MTKVLAATATAPAGPVIHTKSQRPPRARGRPRKVKPPPNSKGLPGLPTEIIGRIASFLLPTPIDASYGFAPPTELPYGHKTGIRQATKLYAHGGIPSGVRDVLRLARTCRRCDRAVSLVVGKIGDASGTKEKSILYTYLPTEILTSTTGQEPFDFKASRCHRVMQNIGASQRTLERLIVYKCPHETHTYSPNFPIHGLAPFQDRDISFPRLRHLQLGPSLCKMCTGTLLRLFCSTKFRKGDSDFDEDTQRYMHHEGHGYLRRYMTEVETDSPAAPGLTTLVLSVGSHARLDYDLRRGLREAFTHIANPHRIETLQLWLSDLRDFGGLHTSGSVSHIIAKDAKTVEDGLSKWAEQEVAKQQSTQDRLLAKFTAQAKSALPVAKRKSGDKADAASSSRHGDKSGGDDCPDDDACSVKSEVKSEASNEETGSNSNAPPNSSADAYGENRANKTKRISYGFYRQCLTEIAQTFPNLVGLSVLYTAGARLAIVEGFSTLQEIQESLVQPIAKLHRLRHLDLGLAAVTPSEVTDFPLGLSLSTTRLGKRKAKDVDTALQALKRRKYTLDMNKAKTDGDCWRRSILEKFVDMSCEPAQGLESSAPPQPDRSRSTSSEPPSDPNAIWPRSLRSGYFVVPDLENRMKGSGLMLPWRVDGQKVLLDQPIKMKL